MCIDIVNIVYNIVSANIALNKMLTQYDLLRVGIFFLPIFP